MTFGRLLWRNLFYHWRGNSAVLLGVAVGTAVLTGALLVGDSLRGSLEDLTRQRLGWVDQALVGGRFFREDVAAGLPAARVSPALLLRGAATGRRTARVTILGVDARFWPQGQAPGGEEFWQSDREEVVLNTALARRLEVGPGDGITLHLQKASAVPRESLLGRRDVDDVSLTVKAVLPDEGLGRFSLSPTQEVPQNAFVPLRALQTKLDLEGRVNALLAGGGSPGLQQALKGNLRLEDWGLVLQTPEERARHEVQLLRGSGRGDKLRRFQWQDRVPEELAEEAKGDVLTADEVVAYYRRHHAYLSLQSRQLFLEPALVRAAEEAANKVGLRTAPTLVYLADTISDGTREIPYAVVAALDPAQAPPLGPFLPAGVKELHDDEIVLADWKESPLKARPGDVVTLSYHRPDLEGRLDKLTAPFRLRGLVELKGPADDPDLTPEFRGVTDKLDMAQWEKPFPDYDPKRVKKEDEDYWKRYRTTPKAYITLARGRQLWGSRFGDLTSLRLAPAGGTPEPGDWSAVKSRFAAALLAGLRPEDGGLVFDDVRGRGLAASKGGTDFGELFLYFSFFLIGAALLLVGLLFRLNLDRRATEIGLLLAAGYRRGRVRGLLLAEGGVLAAVGGVLGCAAAVLYARLLLDYLKTRWPKELHQSFLELHLPWPPWSFVLGYGAALVVSLLTILWAVRILGRVSPRALLAGETAEAGVPEVGRRAVRWSRWIMILATVGALACAVSGLFVRDEELKASSFFGSGALLLTGGLAAVWAWMRGGRPGRVSGQEGWALARLAVRNSARAPVRSLLTAGLLASATFLIIAVESFHRDPGRDFLNRDGGSGGFVLLAESALPIYQDVNTTKRLEGVTVYAFRLRAGDDASCLNLYQPRRPRMLGVPHALVARGGFRFQDSLAKTPAERENRWLLLEDHPPGAEIPVFGEANTVTWMLKSQLNGSLKVPNEGGQEVPVRVAGLLADSIFQSELLASEADFLKLYPDHEGYNFFLIDVQPPARPAEVKDLLEQALAERGFEVTYTARRLASYLAVENTYLSTFQALGGLGLLLGALGLAVVLLRSVWERRGELALLRALGYRQGALGWLVFTENAFLLTLGLVVGAAAALLAVAPHLASGAGEVPWPRLLALLGMVLAVGLVAGAAAVISALRAPLLPALRRE